MATLTLTMHTATELEELDVPTLDSVLGRVRSARACLDGYEALVGSALEKARRRPPADVPRPGSMGPGAGGTAGCDGDPTDAPPDPSPADGADDGRDRSGPIAPPLSAREARRLRERAQRLELHPDVRDALVAGRLTTEQADLLTNGDLPADDVKRLLADALAQTTDETRTAVREAVRARHERTAEDHLRRQRRARRGSCGVDDDGMIWFSVRLDPVTGTPIKEEFDRRENREYRKDLEQRDRWKRRNAAQRGADIIGDLLANGILAAGARPAAASTCPCSHHPPRRPSLDLIAGIDTLSAAATGAVAHTSDGVAVPAELARASLCIADIRLWFTNTTRTELYLGNRVELATPAIRQALLVRDGTCRWRGCSVEASRCEAHHLIFRREGGPSDLPNFALLCPRHHRYLHAIGAHLRMGDSADQWLLVDDHTRQVIDRWTMPTPRRARPPNAGDADADEAA